MLYFTLPNFYSNFKINEFFIKLNQEHSECFKYPIAFVGASGNFPYIYWNGGFNNCKGPGSKYENVYDCNKEISIPLRLNCSNIYIGQKDFEDSIANTILSICHDSSNIIEISNIDFYKYLFDKFPKYKFIFSKEADLIHPFSSKIINEINEKNYFYLISLPTYMNHNLEELKQIKNKKNIELTINSLCESCLSKKECQKNSHLFQYNFSQNNPYISCNYRKKGIHKIEPIISLEDIINTYQPLGFTNYKIEEIENNNFDNLFVFLVNYFIKDEFKNKVYEYAIEKGVLFL